MDEEVIDIINDCRQAITTSDEQALLSLIENLHYADLADLYEDLDTPDRQYLIQVAGAEKFAAAIAELPDSLVEEALDQFQADDQRDILESIPDDDRVDILQDVSPSKRKKYISLLKADEQDITRSLLKYSEDTAGGRMTTQVGKVFHRTTVKEALDNLRHNLESTETLARIYVLDENEKLIGKIRLRDLAFSTWDAQVSTLLQPVEHSILATADQEEAATMFRQYDMTVLPVIDESNRFLGIITHDDVIEIIEEESTEDIEKLAGISGEGSEESYLNTSILTHFKRRAGWLFILALLAIASGYVMLRYESYFHEIFLLSLFLPMVIAAGGNTGGQASTMVIRAMALGEVELTDLRRIAWKELRLGLILGSFLATSLILIVILILPLFNPPLSPHFTLPRFGLAVAIAMATQVTTSTLIGALLPMFARSLKIDPAVIAAPAITTIVDVTGMIIYLTVAGAVLGL